jgi:1,4-alpha-glucan branching enzyme
MDNFGSLLIVLHSHLPFGLGHDPMEEHWLYEAAVETYLPLLDMAARLGRAEILPGFAVSFTPVLLDQLADPRFKRGFKNYLATHARVAEEERLIRGRRKESGLARLQQMWRDYYSNALSYFSDTLREDIPGAFRRAAGDGAFELMTSAATHGYLPLIGLDENVRAQIELAIATHQRHFGASPRGFWLPECGFRPAGHWRPPVHHGKLGDHDRRGVDDFIREAGIDYFFADQPQLKMSPPDYQGNSPLRLYREGRLDDMRRPLGVYTRDFTLSRLVWQSDAGYPGDFLYLDFHKKTESGKFRLWRITDAQAGLDRKDEYDPVRAFNQVGSHASHFLTAVREALKYHYRATGERGVVVAAFDAELFGHWWFEGIAWLEQVVRLAAHEPLTIETPARYFDRNPPSRHVELRESSWGLNNDHSVWTREDGKWVWWDIYEAETTMQHLGYLLDGSELSPALAQVLRQAMRELLILEASDWTFMINNWSTRDHAERRAHSHFDDFSRMAEMAGRMAAGAQLNPEERNYVRETCARDAVFPELDLNLFWRSKFHLREAGPAAIEAPAAPAGAVTAPVAAAARGAIADAEPSSS